MAQKARVYQYARRGGLGTDKYSNLIGQLISYKKMKSCEYGLGGCFLSILYLHNLQMSQKSLSVITHKAGEAC
jgi:hypothetical protein